MIERRGGQAALAADQHRGAPRGGVLPDRRPLHARVRRPRATPAPRGGPVRGSSATARSPASTRGGDDHHRRRDRRGARSRPTPSSAPPAPGRRASGPWRASTFRSSRCAARSSPPSPIPGLDPRHAVHHRLRAPPSTSTARATACSLGMSDPDETPGFKLTAVRRVAAAARRGHRAARARASARSASPAAGRGSTR